MCAEMAAGYGSRQKRSAGFTREGWPLRRDRSAEEIAVSKLLARVENMQARLRLVSPETDDMVSAKKDATRWLSEIRRRLGSGECSALECSYAMVLSDDKLSEKYGSDAIAEAGFPRLLPW